MKSSIIAFLLLLMPFAAFSGVNLKNGNFYISYTDIIVPGHGHDLEVIRTYNSKSADKGWFGFGWGSDYETYLTVSADGSVVVHENGSGSLTRFNPKKAVDPEGAAKKILQAMRKRTTVSEKVAADLIRKLKNDAELRMAYAKRFDVKAKLTKGTVLYSNTRGLQKVVKTASGYQRIYNDGKVEVFNDKGKLLSISDKNKFKVSLTYGKNTFVKAIKDSKGKQLFFEWYADGKVKSVSSGADKKKTLYKYEGDDLVESTDVGGNTFKYGYDHNHNMVKITYKDKSSQTIKYTPKTQFVQEVVSRNGESTKYKYESNPKNPDFHYWTTVQKKTASGKKSKYKYEYEIKTKPDGSHYTYRIATTINGLKTETIYSECCSLPLKITRGKQTTRFKYNDKGLLVEKNSNRGDFIKLDYHKKFNKITSVVNKKGRTDFAYDKKGNLTQAKNAKKSVFLTYNRYGQIKKMKDKDRKNGKIRHLEFTYNALGKPIVIKMKNVGKIEVEYDNYGEIKQVKSAAGHKMALQVTQAFQSLLAIVKPAGVNLNM